DGQRLGVMSVQEAGPQSTTFLEVWELAKQQKLHALPIRTGYFSAAALWSGKGPWVAAISSGRSPDGKPVRDVKWLTVFDADTGAPIPLGARAIPSIHTAAFDPAGPRLAAVLRPAADAGPAVLQVWTLPGGREEVSLPLPGQAADSAHLSFSANGK